MRPKSRCLQIQLTWNGPVLVVVGRRVKKSGRRSMLTTLLLLLLMTMMIVDPIEKATMTMYFLCWL